MSSNWYDTTTIDNLISAINVSRGNSDTALNTFDRAMATAGIPTVAGRCDVACFTPIKNLTVTKLTAMAGATAWTGATLIRLGLYTIDDASLAVTLVAASASDTTLFAAANGAYQKALSTGGGLPSSYQLVAGSRYAFAVLGVGQTAGNLRGMSVTGTLQQRHPVLGGSFGSGLTDLPTSGTLAATGTQPWGELDA